MRAQFRRRSRECSLSGCTVVAALVVLDRDSRNWHSWPDWCRRTINVPGYNAIICYRLSPSTIELRAYHYRAGAFLTLGYFCQGQMFLVINEGIGCPPSSATRNPFLPRNPGSVARTNASPCSPLHLRSRWCVTRTIKSKRDSLKRSARH